MILSELCGFCEPHVPQLYSWDSETFLGKVVGSTKWAQLRKAPGSGSGAQYLVVIRMYWTFSTRRGRKKKSGAGSSELEQKPKDVIRDSGSSSFFSSPILSVGIGSHGNKIAAASPSITSTFQAITPHWEPLSFYLGRKPLPGVFHLHLIGWNHVPWLPQQQGHLGRWIFHFPGFSIEVGRGKGNTNGFG